MSIYGMPALVALISLLPLTGACSVQSNVDRVYTMEVDEKATSPTLDRAIEADRKVEHLDLGTGAFGLAGPRMVSIDPAGDVRNGVMVSQDARTHSGDAQERLKAVPGVEITRTIEIGTGEGGEQMVRAMAAHPVLLASVRFDCARGSVTYLSYHAADTYTGPFAYSFRIPDPQPRTMAGPMLDAACKGAPAGIASPRNTPART